MLLHEEGIPGLDVTGIDFEGLARGYGIEFRRVLDPDQISLNIQQAIGSRKPNLIEIPIDKSVRSFFG